MPGRSVTLSSSQGNQVGRVIVIALAICVILGTAIVFWLLLQPVGIKPHFEAKAMEINPLTLPQISGGRARLVNIEITPEYVRALLAARAKVQVLYIDNCTLRQGALQTLAPADLIVLAFFQTSLSQDDVAALSHMNRLLALGFERVTITPDEIRSLDSLRNLNALTLSDCALSDDQIRALKGFTSLITLQISDCTLDTSLLATAVSKLPRLRTLLLAHSSVDDRDVASICRLPHLKSLDLSATKITDASLKHLPSLPALKELLMNDTAITDLQLQQLGKVKSLRTLAMAATAVSDPGLISLRQCKSLKAIDLSHTSVTVAGLRSLQSLPKLRLLCAEACPLINHADFLLLKKDLPNCKITFDSKEFLQQSWGNE